MTETSLQDIQELTANYSDRQGLRLVPLALAVMIQAFPRFFPAKLLGVDSMLLALAAGFAGYWLIGRLYRKRFGEVDELPYEGSSLLTQVALVAVAFIVSVGVDLTLHPPVFVSGLVIAAWLIITAWPSRHIRKEYASIGLVLVAVSLQPLVGESTASVARNYGFVFGFMLLIAAIRDHLAFTRFFRPLESLHE